jgi:prophage tail gpP-like protein
MLDDGAVEIRFDGVRYGFWQKAEIRESVDDLCASLSLAVTLPGHGDNLGINANTVIEALIAGERVTTVRLDSLTRSVGAESHDISLEGRSLGRELVDSQYSKTLSGLKLEEIAKRLCADFKVPLTVSAKTVSVPDFAMQCESPANALINAARAANLLLYPTPDGGLMLAEPTDAAPVATLIYGEHILDYEVTDEYRLRFSEYCVKGYDYAGDKPNKGRVKDDGITFYRPMQIVADKHGKGQGGCERRAELERNRRLARAHRIELSVQGWRFLMTDDRRQKTEGWRLWAINTQARVVIPQEGIDDVFLIGDRAFRLDDRGGHVTRLTLMRREAYAGSGDE